MAKIETERFELFRFCSDTTPLTGMLNEIDSATIYNPPRMAVITKDIIHAAIKAKLSVDDILERNTTLQERLAGTSISFTPQEVYTNHHRRKQGKHSNLIMLRPSQATFEQIQVMREVIGSVFTELNPSQLRTPTNLAIARSSSGVRRDELFNAISSANDYVGFTLVYGQAEPISNIGLYRSV